MTGWFTDWTPSARWPHYTRSNAGEVLPSPASPLGQTFSWEGGLCLGWADGYVRIGSYSLFGPAVQIYTPMHPFNAEQRRSQEFGKPVDIGSDVWVGGGALILPGVRIGARAVIGAGSVVTRDVPDGVFAAGNPCRVIREIGADAPLP